tara:strand:- start:291 stop:524 length:234 start_codon:yes stop_codon:yes gene_type:complete
MIDIKILSNLRVTFLIQFFFLIYSLVVVSIFYRQLKKDNKTISEEELDGTGITLFVVLGLSIVFTMYHIYHSYKTIK